MTQIEQVLGWETIESSGFPGPADIVPAPQPTAAPLSLVTACAASGRVFETDAGVPFDGGYDDVPAPALGLQGPSVDRWVQGFQFLQELAGPASGYAWCQDAPMGQGNNCYGPSVVSVFEAIYLDERSTAGWKASDALARVQRALQAHEAWRVENEWWTGALNPSNPHLSQAAPFYPVAAQGGDPGDASGLQDSLGLLEQSIASHDAGVGMIHCTPFVFNAWATRGGIPFRYDGSTPSTSARIWTPNGNLVIPGYGYDGSGPVDFQTEDNPDMQWATQQWAYATDMVSLLKAPIITEPKEYADMSPDIVIRNNVPWRATRPWAIYSNGWLRAAVLVDTTVL
jgi:hypothetical protein